MPNLNDICQQIIDNNAEVMTVGVVEQESALLLGLASDSDELSLDYCETLAAAIVNMYRGRNVRTVESMIAMMRGQDTVPGIEKIHLVMNEESIFITGLAAKPDFLFFFITHIDSDIELVWDIIGLTAKIIAGAE